MLNNIGNVGLAFFAGFLIFMFAMKAPQIHSNWIRNKVGSQVVMIVNEAHTGGGTGFAVQTPHGQTLTLTNSHICAMGDNIYAKLREDRYFPLHKLEVSQKTDLCLLEGVPGLSGIKVADDVYIGQELGLVGHPELMPLTLSKGELIGYDNRQVVMDFQGCKEENEQYKTVITIFGPLCVRTVYSGLTTIVALPGNSGSPTVDFMGHLVGVLFAGGGEASWGLIIPLKDVKEFLRDY